MPTQARKSINRHIEEFSHKVREVLSVGVNYQWDKHYKILFDEFTTLDVKPETHPNFVDDIQKSILYDKSYEGVLIFAVWELVDVDKTALEIKRILKNNGKLLFGFPGKSFTLRHRTFIVKEVDDLIRKYFTLEWLDIVYYKSKEPFYIIGEAKK